MFIYAIILLAIIARFIPHMPNFAPITAVAIFSGAYLPKKHAVGVTLAARFLSDLLLGFFAWPLMAAVYASHLAGAALGLWIKNSKGYYWLKITASPLMASALFFFVTNFAFLYRGYLHNWSGIMQSYVNALPFFRGTVLGDVFYTVAMFAAYGAVMAFRKRQAASAVENLYLNAN